ncbi:MAG TPA: hypothetical protein VHX65_07280 [Pirellulales bacterium]|nr:hypothetical protein [Pirellulales bacterium]
MNSYEPADFAGRNAQNLLLACVELNTIDIHEIFDLIQDRRPNHLPPMLLMNFETIYGGPAKVRPMNFGMPLARCFFALAGECIG